MSNPSKPTKKQQRDEHRQQQLATFKKKQAAQNRNRLIGIVLGIVGVLAVVSLVTTILIVSNQPQAAGPAVPDVEVGDVQTFPGLEQTHTTDKVDYEMSPPAGGPHNPTWLNCGIYSKPVPNENAVHDLEHGAIWITYDPALSEKEVTALRAATPSSYAVLSPFPGLDAPIAVSAWGAQLKFNSPDDPAFTDFITTYWRSASAPEPGAPCTGGIDGPGKVS
ncbi:DUF3105 domain-containing protein [soil metagenome]